MTTNRLAAYWDAMEAVNRDAIETTPPVRLTPQQHFSVNIRKALQRWRKAGWKVNDLAAQLRVKPPTISKWPTQGLKEPNDNLRLAAELLHVDVDSLFTSRLVFTGDIPRKKITVESKSELRTYAEKLEFLLKSRDRRTVELMLDSLVEKHLATAKR